MPADFELVSFLHPDNPPRPYPVWTWVVNDDLHLIHVVRGGGVAIQHGKRLRMRPEDVFWIEPYVEYCVHADERGGLEMLNFHFHLSAPGGASLARLRRLPARFRPEGVERILGKLRGWYARWAKGGAFEKAWVAGRLHALALAYAARHGRPQAPAEGDREMAALAREFQRGARPEFDAEAVAATVYLSASQMNRRFRAAFGTSPKDYWLKHRHARARARLQESDAPVAEVAAALGFEDAAYFSRWFKRLSGVAPLAYRKKARAGRV
ncbi:MAG: AraC family transcriptional regulator [Planctomycetota bacterium]|nr:AraC family transcriptional regulator [Planctomycetota bacterium]